MNWMTPNIEPFTECNVLLFYHILFLAWEHQIWDSLPHCYLYFSKIYLTGGNPESTQKAII